MRSFRPADLFKNPFFYFVLFLLGAEWAAWAVSPFRSVPASSQTPRNPFLRRAWPEYLGADVHASKDEPLVVVISHSQGVAAEVRDAEDTYVALLQKEFRKAGIPARIENWSSGPLRTSDIELLSMKAVQRKADLVVFLLGYRNIDLFRFVDLDFPGSGIDLLAGEPSLWPFFKGALFFEHATWGDIGKRFFNLHSPFLRQRAFVYDWLAAAVPREWHRPLFGKPLDVIRVHDLRNLPPLIDPEKRRALLERQLSENPPLSAQEVNLRFTTFKKFYPALHKRLREHGVPFLWVWSPGAIEAVAGERAREVERIQAICSGLVRASGVRCVDLTRAIPPSRFYGFAHLDEEGHRLLSGLLFPEIVRELRQR